jgi:hypothetical protein
MDVSVDPAIDRTDDFLVPLRPRRGRRLFASELLGMVQILGVDAGLWPRPFAPTLLEGFLLVIGDRDVNVTIGLRVDCRVGHARQVPTKLTEMRRSNAPGASRT